MQKAHSHSLDAHVSYTCSNSAIRTTTQSGADLLETVIAFVALSALWGLVIFTAMYAAL